LNQNNLHLNFLLLFRFDGFQPLSQINQLKLFRQAVYYYCLIGDHFHFRSRESGTNVIQPSFIAL